MRTAQIKPDLRLGFVLIFVVIGHNTINIPEIFQVFTAFLVAVQCNPAILVTNLREKKT